jgi:AraC-like DNA-binding protein
VQVVRAVTLRGVWKVALSLGVDIEPMLAEMGLALSDLNGAPEKYVSARLAIDLVEKCAELCAAPDFGLRAGEAYDISVLGPVALAAVHAPTARRAMEIIKRNLHLINAVWRVDFTPSPDGEGDFLSLRPIYKHPTPAVQSTERVMTFTHKALGVVSARSHAPREVWLQHEPVSPLARYREAFGVTPEFGMPVNGFDLSHAQWDAINPSRNEGLCRIAESYLEREFPCPTDNLADQVRVICERALVAGECSQRSVAAMLGLHERTLQRRLQAQAASFEQIKDEARRDLAQRYLARRDISLSNISSLLGYAESTAFTRSCHRWFGAAPSAVRARLSGQDAA